MPNIDPQVLAQMLKAKAGSAMTQGEANSFLAAQPTPSMDYMRQTAGAALTPYEIQQLQMQQQQMQGR